MVFWNSENIIFPKSKINILFRINTSNKKNNDYQLELIDIEYADDTKKQSRKQKNISIIDYRHVENPLSVLNKLMNEKQLSIYAEGDSAKIEYETFYRLNLKKVNKLVIWTIPPGLKELKHIVSSTSPNFIYLFGNRNKINNTYQLLNKIGGMINFSINKSNGIILINKIAFATNLSNKTIILSIKYFEAIGKIKIHEEDKEKFVVKHGNRSKENNAKNILISLQRQIDETNSFHKYYLSVDPEQMLSSII